MLTFHSPDHQLHNPDVEVYLGELVSPFECPDRVNIVLEQIEKTGLGAIIKPQQFGIEPVLAVHDNGFIEFLQNCWLEWQATGLTGQAIASSWPTRHALNYTIPNRIVGKIGHYCLCVDVAITSGTWQAVDAGKDVALSALSAIYHGDQAAFGLCRPPGHHATIDQYGGYCFVNNAAIAAQHARSLGYERVAILDVDFHHGNGTQQIFYDRNDVLFVSIHADPTEAFPYYSGSQNEIGVDSGVGYNLNYTYGKNTTYAQWSLGLIDGLKKIQTFGAGLIIVSLGVDTYEHDPISFFKLRSDDFTDYGKRIGGLQIPTLFLMEGGYAIEQLGVNTVNVLQGFESV